MRPGPRGTFASAVDDADEVVRPDEVREVAVELVHPVGQVAERRGGPKDREQEDAERAEAETDGRQRDVEDDQDGEDGQSPVEVLDDRLVPSESNARVGLVGECILELRREIRRHAEQLHLAVPVEDRAEDGTGHAGRRQRPGFRRRTPVR